MKFEFFDKIWTDCIVQIRSKPENQNSWKAYCMFFMTMAMAFNLIFIMTILQKFILKNYFYYLNVDFFHGTKLDAAFSFFVLFFLPNLLFNYFYIFRNNKYELLIKKYKSFNGKLFFSYFVISIGGPIIILGIAFVIQRFT